MTPEPHGHEPRDRAGGHTASGESGMAGRRRSGVLTWLRRHRLPAVIGAAMLIGAGAWGVKLVLLAQSVDGYRTYWAGPRGEPGGLVYVALGDSAAQGIGASHPERGYVGLLAERIREQTGRPVQVVNLSRSGATVRDLLDTQLSPLRELRRTSSRSLSGGTTSEAMTRPDCPPPSTSSPLPCPPARSSPTSRTSCMAAGGTARPRRLRSSPRARVHTSCASSPFTTCSAVAALAPCSPTSPPTGSTPTTAVIACGRTPSGAS